MHAFTIHREKPIHRTWLWCSDCTPIRLLPIGIPTRIHPPIFIPFNDLTFYRADSYTRSLSSRKDLSTGLGNGVRIVSRSVSCQSVSQLGSTYPFLFHSMTLHFTERIHTRVHYPPGRTYPSDLVMVCGLYPDPPPASRYLKLDPPTHFYSIQ
jgi:hypothetical protein